MRIRIKNMPVRVREQDNRLGIVINEGSAQEKVDKLVQLLLDDGFDFGLEADLMTPIEEAERVVSAGMGLGNKDNISVVQELAEAAGAAMGCSRPASERMGLFPKERLVGMTGQKFKGTLYIACGISGALQHLKGIEKAHTVVAININPEANIFAHADYGIVGDLFEIVPLLAAKLNSGLPRPVYEEGGSMDEPLYKESEAKAEGCYVCPGCGYEYDPAKGDPAAGIAPGTAFEDLPDTWTCPECGVSKSGMISSVTKD